MAKIIKTAATEKAREFNVGDVVQWDEWCHDGRVSYTNKYTGTVCKVCKVNLHVQDTHGNVWQVRKTEVA